jgi:hypothetical protein
MQGILKVELWEFTQSSWLDLIQVVPIASLTNVAYNIPTSCSVEKFTFF